jgi:hypothetical protein
MLCKLLTSNALRAPKLNCPTTPIRKSYEGKDCALSQNNRAPPFQMLFLPSWGLWRWNTYRILGGAQWPQKAARATDAPIKTCFEPPPRNPNHYKKSCRKWPGTEIDGYKRALISVFLWRPAEDTFCSQKHCLCIFKMPFCKNKMTF